MAQKRKKHTNLLETLVMMVNHGMRCMLSLKKKKKPVTEILLSSHEPACAVSIWLSLQ